MAVCEHCREHTGPFCNLFSPLAWAGIRSGKQFMKETGGESLQLGKPICFWRIGLDLDFLGLHASNSETMSMVDCSSLLQESMQFLYLRQPWPIFSLDCYFSELQQLHIALTQAFGVWVWERGESGMWCPFCHLGPRSPPLFAGLVTCSWIILLQVGDLGCTPNHTY